jgi:outer membrane protein assembly factor BamD
MKIQMRKALLIAMAGLVLSGCGEYNRVLKSKDVDYKYEYAKKAYEEQKYVQASTILTDLITPLRGGPKGEESLYLLAMSYYKNKDYMNSGVYFKTYYTRYPRGKYIEDARFYCANGYDLESPDPQLDQSVTLKAIEEYQAYIDYFPKGDRVEIAQESMFRLQDKLTLKELQNALLYYNMGMYLGNNYESAIVVSQNAIKNYPYSKYKEEFEMLILKSKYQIAKNSVDEKKEDRYRDVIDEYYSFINNYPESSNKKEAENIYKISKNHVKN